MGDSAEFGWLSLLGPAAKSRCEVWWAPPSVEPQVLRHPYGGCGASDLRPSRQCVEPSQFFIRNKRIRE
eukprot:COSAG01_NODE_2862_length_6958_cov_21.483015_2_plen_69_part_00